MRNTTSIPMALALSLVVALGASAQEGTLFVEGDNVGIGVSTPISKLHLATGEIRIGGHTTGERSSQALDFQISGLRNVIYNIDSDNNSGNASFSVSRDGNPNAVVFVTREDGRTGINLQFPAFPLQVGTTPSDGNGAYLSPEGVWTNSSSRSGKENIRSLSPDEALGALADLEPVRYTGKGSTSEEEYVGFIAEDVPDLVAVADRKGLSAMDIVAVLTRVVQVQQTQLVEERTRALALEQRLLELEATVGDLAAAAGQSANAGR